jgi:hypothetical protein
MLYWLTATAGSAARMYYEGRKHAEAGWFPLTRSEVPTAVANFADDMALRRWAEEANTIVRWSEFDRGRTLRGPGGSGAADRRHRPTSCNAVSRQSSTSPN